MRISAETHLGRTSLLLLLPRDITHLGRAGSVKASRRRSLLKIDRWPLMLATLTTRPALLLRDGSNSSNDGRNNSSGSSESQTNLHKRPDKSMRNTTIFD